MAQLGSATLVTVELLGKGSNAVMSCATTEQQPRTSGKAALHVHSPLTTHRCAAVLSLSVFNSLSQT